MVSYGIKLLSEKDICDYLTNNDKLFKPALSTRLNIKDYSKKLQTSAVHFCASDSGRLIGFIACYLNDPDGMMAYISSVSSNINYQRQGIVSTLLNMVITYARHVNFKYIKLEVYSENETALTLYEKSGFEILTSGEKHTMQLKLNE
jgi:ribosomal protein S18 acetylase RimI-like enzyme